MLSILIDGTGAVRRATVAESSADAPAVERCIAQAVERWRFPAPRGGVIVGVRYPFVLGTGAP